MRLQLGRSVDLQGSFTVVLTFALMSLAGQSASALITGGEGNEPVADPGWPKNAVAVFNTKSRVAFWEGPPFGGGQHHAECRGDDAALQRVLDDFAKIDTPLKRVILHDGVGRSFWLNPNREANNIDKAKLDWVFMVWQHERRNLQRRLPVGISAVGKRDAAILAQLDVYTGGSIRLINVAVPAGIDLFDQRLEAHGFSVEDGVVLEGKVIDLVTRQPLKSKLQLQRMEALQAGGYLYSKLVEVDTDDNGHWVLKNAPQERCRLVLSAEGYVSRVIGYEHYDNNPQWSEHHSGLSKTGVLTGRVVDQQGKPLADAEVRITEVDVKNSGGYAISDDSSVTTDADGHFSFESIPIGSTSIWVRKPGYVRPGPRQTIEIPAADIKLEMQTAARLRVTVDFSATKRSGGYLVHVEPAGGEKIGQWSGDGDIDANNVITYENIPSGQYVVSGRPNPGRLDQQTEPVTIDLKGGDTIEVTFKAK